MLVSKCSIYFTEQLILCPINDPIEMYNAGTDSNTCNVQNLLGTYCTANYLGNISTYFFFKNYHGKSFPYAKWVNVHRA